MKSIPDLAKKFIVSSQKCVSLPRLKRIAEGSPPDDIETAVDTLITCLSHTDIFPDIIGPCYAFLLAQIPPDARSLPIDKSLTVLLGNVPLYASDSFIAHVVDILLTAFPNLARTPKLCRGSSAYSAPLRSHSRFPHANCSSPLIYCRILWWCSHRRFSAPKHRASSTGPLRRPLHHVANLILAIMRLSYGRRLPSSCSPVETPRFERLPPASSAPIAELR
jgi:hypothetical protein